VENTDYAVRRWVLTGSQSLADYLKVAVKPVLPASAANLDCQTNFCVG